MRRLLLAVLILAACRAEQASTIVVGSKNFTESVILGELLAQTLEKAGCTVERRLNLGGTLVVDRAIRAGEIHAYVEYSGTALTAILNHPTSRRPAEVTDLVRLDYANSSLHWGPNLGFENTFAMIVRGDDGRNLSLSNISDLRRVATEFQPAFGYEFAERPDGWSALQEEYDLTFEKSPKTMDLGLTYRALAAKEADLIAGNSTDGLIDSLGFIVLEDDRAFFPPYDAAVVSVTAISDLCPGSREALDALDGMLDEEAMRRLNHQVDALKRDPGEVVRGFLGGGGAEGQTADGRR